MVYFSLPRFIDVGDEVLETAETFTRWVVDLDEVGNLRLFSIDKHIPLEDIYTPQMIRHMDFMLLDKVSERKERLVRISRDTVCCLQMVYPPKAMQLGEYYVDARMPHTTYVQMVWTTLPDGTKRKQGICPCCGTLYYTDDVYCGEGSCDDKEVYI